MVVVYFIFLLNSLLPQAGMMGRVITIILSTLVDDTYCKKLFCR